jgi:hypothetical protein
MESVNNDTACANKERNVYKALKKVLKKALKKHLIINCSNCNETLFTNKEIVGAYITSLADFYLIIDPACLIKILNIHFTETVTNNHPLIPEKLLIGQVLQCPNCFSDIGVKIISACLGKEFLLSKFIIPIGKLSAFILDEYNCYDYDFKTMFNTEEYAEKYIKELKVLNKKLEENVDEISSSLNVQSYFIKVKNEMCKASEQFDRLIKIAKYNNFICK